MQRSLKLTVLLGLALAVVAGSGFVAWRHWRGQRTFYSDGETIRQPVKQAIVRDVLWRPPVALPVTINSDANEHESRLSADGLMLFFVRGKAGEQADLFVSIRVGENGQQWTEPEPLAILNTSDDELGPEPSRDGRSLLFYSNRPGGSGGYDIWVSQRMDGVFQPPINLGPAINSEFDELNPSLTPAGDQLYFASTRPHGAESGHRNSDLYCSSISAEGAFAPAVALTSLNTLANETGPCVSPAGDFLYFSSDRKEGWGGFDLYRSRVVHGEVREPVNLGSQVNTADNERTPGSCLDGFGLHFSSDRVSAGAAADRHRNSDLYYTTSREVFKEVAPAPPINWATIATLLLPAVLWALLGLTGVVLLLMMIRGVQRRQMSLLVRCLVASLGAHLALLIMLTFWQVTTSLVDVFEQEGSTQVAITSSIGGDGLYAQVRGGLTSLDLASDVAATARTATELPRESGAESVQLDAPRTQVAFDDRQAMQAALRDAPEYSQQLPAVERIALDSPLLRSELSTPQSTPLANTDEAAPATRGVLAPDALRNMAIAVQSSQMPLQNTASIMSPVVPMDVSMQERLASGPQLADAAIAAISPQRVGQLDTPTTAPLIGTARIANPPSEAPQRSAETATALASGALATRKQVAAQAVQPDTVAGTAVAMSPQRVVGIEESQSIDARSSKEAIADSSVSVASASNATALPGVSMPNGGATGVLLVVPKESQMATGQDATVALNQVGGAAPRVASATGIASSAASSPVAIEFGPQKQAASGDASMASSNMLAASEAKYKQFAAMPAEANSALPSVAAGAGASTNVALPTEQGGPKVTADLAVALHAATGTSRRSNSSVGGAASVDGESTGKGVVDIPPQTGTSAEESSIASARAGFQSEAALNAATGGGAESSGVQVPKVAHAGVSSSNLALPSEQGENRPEFNEAGVAALVAVKGQKTARSDASVGRQSAIESGQSQAQLSPTKMPESPVSDERFGNEGTRLALGEAGLPQTSDGSLVSAPTASAVGLLVSSGEIRLPNEFAPTQTANTSDIGEERSGGQMPVSQAGTSRRAHASGTVSGSRDGTVQLVPNTHAATPSGESSLANADRARDGSAAGGRSSTPHSSSAVLHSEIRLPAVAMGNVSLPTEQLDQRFSEPGHDDKPMLASATGRAGARSAARMQAAVASASSSSGDSLSTHLPPERDSASHGETWILKTDQRINDAPMNGGSKLGALQTSRVDASNIGAVALDLHIPNEVAPAPSPYVQRSEDVRKKVIDQMGGSEETERAVALALKWLAAHQSPDGRWAARGFDQGCNDCGGEAKFDTDVASTALSLLCFLAADHTHMKDGPYRNHVARGLAWLKTQQGADGDFRGGETMYSHGIATIALAEAFGMTSDRELGMPIKKSVDFIAAALDTRVGGWRYEPGQAGDTSVLGWQIMAITSARRAGIPIPDHLFKAAMDWMALVDTPGSPGLYSYQPGQRFSPSMTAEGMFVQQLSGRDHTDARMRASAEYIVQNPPRWTNDPNTYYWYYATLALFQYQGTAWKEWNKNLTEVLLANQRTTGAAAGSWDPLDNWAKIGGRVYQTAICTLSLEVYYRYLPMYAAVKEAGE